ncbi:DUF1206 domain-containing protein [Lentzea sp. NEAU-D13]|uniref:DUF1206 domain-containing protein n=1 Tax=Lentzea alba TaxID=2714351 RepID=A0A7C9VSQ5_9PSEU|nr:DUF1206 domain-containing protein [Lentzea alba]NGY61992.1 DUF1206 domain-containing protein [Lentzea alba]
MVIYGGVHVLVAWLAIQVAFGDSEQADSKGALSDLAQAGAWLLWTIAIGLVFFALWQLILACVGYTYVPKKRKRISKRIGSVARAITAIGIALGAFKYATGSSSGNQNQQQQELTAQVLSLPGGQFIVGAIAIGVIVTAGVIAYKGFKKSFEKDLDMSRAPSWIEPVGRIGWIGKGFAYGVIGVLIGLAAINADPQQAGGMDKALKTLAAQPYGMFLLTAVAIGIAAFGVYCFVAARALKE